jgi:hypothetical protein
MEIERYNFIKDLCEGNSTQSKVSNRILLALLLISANALFTEVDANEKVTLMFGLSTVKPFYHFVFNFFATAILSIGFASAHCQAISSRQLIEKIIGENENAVIHNVKIRELVDSTITPTFQKVGPIEFSKNTPPWSAMRFLDTALYLSLKVFTLVMFYFLPTLVIVTFGKEIISYDDGTYTFSVIAMWIVSIISSLRAFWLDILSISGVVEYKLSGKKSSNTPTLV